MSTTELPPDAYHDTPWTQVLPWLLHHAPGSIRELVDLAPAPDWWLTESPAVTTMAAPHDDLCPALANVLITHYPELSLTQAFPTLSPKLPLNALHIGARGRTALQRSRATTVADLAELCVRTLFDIRGTGAGTVAEITGALVSTAIIRQPSGSSRISDLQEDTFAPAGTNGATAEPLPPAQAQLLEDLVELAVWRRTRETGDRPLLSVAVEDGSPEEIQELALRINSLTANDIAPRSGFADPVAEFTTIVGQLNQRQVSVLRDRFLAPEPRTLGELAPQLGISRQRISQIEKSIKDLFVRTFRFGTTIGNLLASLRVEIQPVASLERLMRLHPELAREIPDLEVPLWLVLDRLDDYFEVTDGWAAAPDAGAAQEHTRTWLENFATEHGVVDLTSLAASTSMPGDELRAWLARCGYPIHQEQVLTRTRSIGDHAAGLLAIAGEPLVLEEILQRTGKDRSLRSLANALACDDRFVRADRSTWALVEWNVEEYTGIRHQIGRELAAAGGTVQIDALIQSITRRFDVSPSSVYTYASSGDYRISDGAVQRREHLAGSRRKDPADTRRLFRDGETWRFRISVTRDHLRGSGFPVPTGVAALVGCDQGDVVELRSRLGVQTIRWTGPQPSSGTVKRFLDNSEAKEGQTAFLEFLPDGRFDLSIHAQPSEAADPLKRVMALIGVLGAADVDDATVILAQAVGLPPDAKPRRILSAYYRRGDDDIATLLEQVWTRRPKPMSEQLSGSDGEPGPLFEATPSPVGPWAPPSVSGEEPSATATGQQPGDPADSEPAPEGFDVVAWVRQDDAEAASRRTGPAPMS